MIGSKAIAQSYVSGGVLGVNMIQPLEALITNGGSIVF